MVEKYIGSLPTAKKAGNVYTDDKVRPVKGGVENDFRVKMEQPKVSVFVGFSGDCKYDMKNQVIASYLSQALRNRYLKSIREEKGGTYGVSASVMLAPRIDEYTVQVMFDTNEQMADELTEIVFAEIEKIAKEGPLAEDIEKSREFFLKNWKNTLEQNNGWMQVIRSWYEEGIDQYGTYEDIVKNLKYSDVQKLAKKILKDNNMVYVVMRPEAAATK